MSIFCWEVDEQINRLRPFFPKNHGKPRGGRPPGAERQRIRQPQRTALASCAERCSEPHHRSGRAVPNDL